MKRKKSAGLKRNVYGTAQRRKQDIVVYVQSSGYASAPEIAARFGVSEATVRRDLFELDMKKAVRRVHGGAMLHNSMPDLGARKKRFIEEKRRIGAKAAGFIEDGDTIFLDGGSTTEEVARMLPGIRVKVITNGLNIANILSNAEGVELILTGGNMYGAGQIMLGPIAEQTLSHLKASKAFISVEGIDKDCISNSNNLVIGTERAMMQRAGKVFVLADRSKFGVRALARLSSLDAIDCVITDRKIKSAKLTFLRRKKIEAIQAG